MLDLIAEGMALRSQPFIQATGVESETNPHPSAKIRNYPQTGKATTNPDTTGHTEDKQIGIRKSAESAPPTVFELSIKTFNRHGIEISPEDLALLRQRLPFEPRRRDATLAHYRIIWHEAMEAEAVPHKKQNKGRFTANTWLRSVT